MHFFAANRRSKRSAMGNESDELPDEDQYEYEDEYSNEEANVSNTCCFWKLHQKMFFLRFWKSPTSLNLAGAKDVNNT